MEKFLNSKSLKIFEQAIGKNSMKYLNSSKVFFSSLIYTRNFEDFLFNNGKLILKNFSNPFIEDWKVYMILRSHCPTWITTGKMLRDENELCTFHDFEFFQNEDVKNYFYRKQNEKESEFSRNILIMTKTIEIMNIKNLKLFHEKQFKKYVMQNDILKKEIETNSQTKFGEYLEKNKIYFIKENINNIKEAILYCKDVLNVKDGILIEAGTNIMENFFLGEKDHDSINCIRDNPIDFLILSVYEGEINNESIGNNIVSINDLKKSGLVLINISEKIYSEKGFLTFYTFVHREIL